LAEKRHVALAPRCKVEDANGYGLANDQWLFVIVKRGDSQGCGVKNVVRLGWNSFERKGMAS
jgi:hypothetical protein